jgi:alpha-methylacyl-CoA racemase
MGPLQGLRVLELAGIGPAPFCGMLFSDMGADVVRIDRPGSSYDRFTVESRGRRSLVLDLKSEHGRATATAMMARAEVVIEGFRPGVMERLGLGPAGALAANPKLVYGRMTGWGQFGPYSAQGGHDINYIAAAGALHGIGPAEQPSVPLNLIGDFGGGALYLAVGILAALRHVASGGEGQVVDSAMSDGTIGLMGLLYGHLARGTWRDQRASNIIDGGSHFYNCYACADGAWLAVGAIEPQFYRALIDTLDIADPDFDDQMDSSRWPVLRARLAGVFATRTRAEWLALFAGIDACVTPVQSMRDAIEDPHNLARQAFVTVDGVVQPAPAPRFSATPAVVRHGPVSPGRGGESALIDWQVDR